MIPKEPCGRWSAWLARALPSSISDEVPNLTDRMLGHKLGIPAIDRWIVSHMMHLGDSFTEMVERHRDLDVQAIAGRVFKEFHYEPVWWGVGYVWWGTHPPDGQPQAAGRQGTTRALQLL